MNATSEGIILEKPITMGENRRKDNGDSTFPRLDIAQEIDLALRSSTATTDYDLTRDMKRLGMERLSPIGFVSFFFLNEPITINQKFLEMFFLEHDIMHWIQIGTFNLSYPLVQILTLVCSKTIN